MSQYADVEIPNLLEQNEREKIYGPELNPLVAQLFYNRNITKQEEVDSFLEFDWKHINDPFLFTDMKKSVDRILDAIDKDQTILIYSDYDTDGIPGGALLRNFFDKINYKHISNYIPNRNTEGYALNMNACEQFVSDGVDLIITVDCGITDNTEVAYLMKHSVDVIITDHHLPEGDIPDAFAVIDHKRDDCTYPDKNLCGAAIAWKLVCALLTEGKQREISEFIEIPDGWEKTLLDLVAISTVCDMVPLAGENRQLVHFGKIILSISPRPGLHTIFTKARLNQQSLQTDDIAFMIGPRINAASRLDDPMIAFEALAFNDERSIAAAEMLEKLNNRRKSVTAKIMKEVWGKIAERDDSNVIVMGNPEWPIGVLGLIAGKIADREKKPTFVWGRSGDQIKGSCRSGSDISVFSLMQHARESFDGFGGHAASGGFETDGEKIHFLEEELSKYIDAADRVSQDPLSVDARISIDEAHVQNHRHIHMLEPFGIANPKPLFVFKEIITQVRIFGKTQNHIELKFANAKGKLVKATAFFREDLVERDFSQGDHISFIASIEKDSYNGYDYVVLRLVDVLS